MKKQKSTKLPHIDPALVILTNPTLLWLVLIIAYGVGVVSFLYKLITSHELFNNKD